ncbi:MAG: formate dehydrogenase accessory sulfurtransferase FdhD [Hyphomonadaceae bacterium]|nr:formate dehydrogenase accessory sulfurtransferase FdhD [Hyphomonadaceae bacterium]
MSKAISPSSPVVGTREALQWRRSASGDDLGGTVARITRAVPDETAIGLAYDSRPHVVLMGAPADIEDLAIGFSLTEGIASPDQIDDIKITDRSDGVLVDMLLSPAGREGAAKARTRAMEGRSSCGLCGVQHLEAATRALPQVGGDLRISRAAIQTALAELEAAQVHGAATRAMHAAAWADETGHVLFVREDVGRHNALDKVIGAAARTRRDPGQAFIVVTSRLSYEMVEKAAMAGIALLVAISAPTALAIRKAEETGMTLVALARSDGHTIFTFPERVIDTPASAKVIA